MLQLTLAALFFVGIHFGIAGTKLRDTLIARQGEATFRAGFSLLSILGILWLGYAYKKTPTARRPTSRPGDNSLP